ncbi:MAG: sigma-70 family RNA polymerase sigma factor [Gemmatimonadales bacterium]
MTTQAELWSRINMAWAVIARRRNDVGPPPPREAPPAPRGDEPSISLPGFTEEVLPWLDAVYRFALRLTKGDASTAEDLVQDTMLRAARFWSQYTRGTNAKAWLFTICRRVYLQDVRRPRHWRERSENALDLDVEELAGLAQVPQDRDPEQEFFHHLLDDEVLQAIDALPDEFREVLILSDLGDLRYDEIAHLLEIPKGTVKSRLSRARRQMQESLWDYAVAAGYVSAPADQETPCE